MKDKNMDTIDVRNIQFIDLQTQQERIGKEIRNRIEGVLAHGKYIMGPEVSDLENALSDFTGAKHCVSCASGTDALLMALMAYDIGPGDAIFTTPFTFIATAEVIALLGATPVFVDIDPNTYNIDPQKLRATIERFSQRNSKLRARGIIPVDLFGLPAEYDEIAEIATDFDLFVLEDGAQSFGARYKGKRAGDLADIAATSFFPAKPLGCYGDGGAIFCNDDEIAGKLRSIRVHGKGGHKYDNVRVGLNGRLDTLQAAILLPKLGIYEDEIKLRNRVAARYTERLSEFVKTPFVADHAMSVWAQYSVRSGKRGEIIEKFKRNGIPSAIYYPKPLHLQTAFTSLGYGEGSFPVSEAVAVQIFSLPMHPYLAEEEQDYIVDVLKRSA